MTSAKKDPDAAHVFAQLGVALRTARNRAGMTGADLAERSGVGKSRLSRYELGKELPTLNTLARLLDALEVDPLWFFHLASQLSRPHDESLRVDLIFAQGGRASGLSPEMAVGFKKVLEDLLELHSLAVEARIAASSLDRVGDRHP